MTTKAYLKFKKTIHRCETLANTYALLKNVKTAAEQDQAFNGEIPAPSDIVRGSVVLAVSALDAYATDAFSEKLVPYIKKFSPNKNLIELLRKAGLDTKESLNLLTMERPYRRIRTLINSYYSSYTTQKSHVIDEIFLPFHLKNITKNAEKMTNRTTIKSSVNKLVERRHEIAHDGDYNSHGRLKDINQKMISKRIQDLELLVKNIDILLCNRI